MGEKTMTSKKPFNLKDFFYEYSIYIILGIMVLIMAIIKFENFATLDNLMNIIRQMTTIGIMALGVTFCIITTGTDLSGGSVIAMCSVISALMAQRVTRGMGGLPTALVYVMALIVPILAGALSGLVNGLFISYGNVPPFIATLGMMNVARGAAMLISDSKPVSNDLPESFLFIGRGKIFGIIPFPAIVFIICAVIAYVLLHRTKFGTYVYAIGGNRNAAVVSGINVKPILTSVYMLCGAFIGVASIVITARNTSGQPSMGVGYDMDAITCAIIGGASFNGGIGTIAGTIVGAFIMFVLINSMNMLQFNPNWQMIIKGAIIILAVLMDEMKNKRA